MSPMIVGGEVGKRRFPSVNNCSPCCKSEQKVDVAGVSFFMYCIPFRYHDNILRSEI